VPWPFCARTSSADPRAAARGPHGSRLLIAPSLVEIYLWRKEPDAAWREAREGGCAESLWMQLAQLRQDAHPEDALPIYQKRVQELVGKKNNGSYGAAVAMMRRVQGTMSGMEPPGDFRAYVAALRAEHRPKRNFMALLDRAGW
jgi:uncharacterized Zn finger protein